MPPIVLQAGTMQMLFSPEDGSVRYVRFDELELLRGVSAPIRDGVWATVRPAISDLIIEQQDASFRVRFNALCENSAVRFRWRGEIEGTSDGDLSFRFDGEALRDFQRNRIGFCVLHGSELSGAPLNVEQVDGRVENGFFPKWIRPVSPFSNIRKLSYALGEMLQAEVLLEGDSFEMEDQRNWSDASFKTYCTPLALPYPVLIKTGERVSQHVQLKVRRSAISTTQRKTVAPWKSTDEVRVEIGQPIGQMLPPLGAAWSSAAHSARAVEQLRELGLAHLRVDLEVNNPACVQKLDQADQFARKLGASLEVALFLDDSDLESISRFRASLERADLRNRIVRWIVFDLERAATHRALVESAEHFLAGYDSAAKFGGGVTDNFAELNRSPAIAKVGDFVCVACNPQVHAFDERSMVETLGMQRLIVRDAARLSDGRPVIISPLTLTRRWRLNEQGAPCNRPAGLMPFQTDPRHSSDFAKAWTFGSVAALSYAGVSSATFFETVGAAGLVREDSAPFPLAAVFRELAKFQGAQLVAARSDDEWRVAVVALKKENHTTVFLANLQAESQAVRLCGGWTEETVALAPYEIARLPGSSNAITTGAT